MERSSLPIAAARQCKLRSYAVRSRGHSKTSSDAIIQHTTIKINPPRNEPVRWLTSPMILGPKNPPMLAVQLMKPTAAAAAELVRNEDGSAQKDGRYATVPKPISVNTTISTLIECGARNHAPNASAAVNCGTAKCQRRSRVRSEFQPSSSIPMRPATNGIAPTQPMRCTSVQP